MTRPEHLTHHSLELRTRPDPTLDLRLAGHLADALALLGCSATVRRAAAQHAREFRLRPLELTSALELELKGQVLRVVVNGTLERRVVLLEREPSAFIACSLGGNPLRTLPWPTRSPADLSFEYPDRAVSLAAVSETLVHRMSKPEILIVALYHPENFPLPRFPLGISDLARATRSRMMGKVTLLDMQLGLTVDDVVGQAAAIQPDILGISSTFGQYDMLMQVMKGIRALQAQPMLVFGGSLSALNWKVLLEQFPDGFVCNGAGERTMQDIVAYWHGDIPLGQIRSVTHWTGDLFSRKPAAPNREYEDVVPELDLLEQTLERAGVMQLESSRGCTHSCSFCPRSHKGRWSGYQADLFERVIAEAERLYDRHPQISRRLFLVDEEFVGSDKNGDALQRAKGVCDLLHSARFQWETSARVDQIFRADRDRDWHVERATFWAYLRDHGLSRCLFGVESGVDSILERFNKHTTGEQNVLAIRLLTALGVPIRCTYITFDQLMTMDELIATYRFQGREDLILRPQPAIRPGSLVDAIHDLAFVSEHAASRQFYSSISYMLVSMEALIDSSYLGKLEQAGLARELQPSMGRRRALFLDERIAVMSDWSQRWIDRSFSFEYTLKSIEKITEGLEQETVRAARRMIKRSAYHLLGRMLAVTSGDRSMLAPTDSRGTRMTMDGRQLTPEAAERICAASFGELVDSFEPVMSDLSRLLQPRRGKVIVAEHARWSSRDNWELING